MSVHGLCISIRSSSKVNLNQARGKIVQRERPSLGAINVFNFLLVNISIINAAAHTHRRPFGTQNTHTHIKM